MNRMLRDCARILCLAMLLAGSNSLRSLHELSHANHGSHSHLPSHEISAISGQNAAHFAEASGDDDCDLDVHANALGHHCGVCDELAAATSDAGLHFEPLVVARADQTFVPTCLGQPCAIESPRVALANPPPTI